MGCNSESRKGLGPVTAVVVFVVIAVLLTAVFLVPREEKGEKEEEADRPKKFSSPEEIKKFIKTKVMEISMIYTGGYYFGTIPFPVGDILTGIPLAAPEAGAPDYSPTNIQVAGVDEADIVKTDGKYIYLVSGNTIFIVEVYPAENARVVSEIKGEWIDGIFVNKDRLVVLGREWQPSRPLYKPAGKTEKKQNAISYSIIVDGVYYYNIETTFVKIYDISDRENPVVVSNFTINGSYFDSRMIGDYVYVVIESPVNYYPYYPEGEEQEISIPRIYSNGVPVGPEFPDVYYFDYPDPTGGYEFVTIMSVNTRKEETPKSEIYLMGLEKDMYVSSGNIYLTYQKTPSVMPFLNKMLDQFVLVLPEDVKAEIQAIRGEDADFTEKMMKIMQVFTNYTNTLSAEEREELQKTLMERTRPIMEEWYNESAKEKTAIHRIAIDSGNIKYRAGGSVQGRVLNQFSMDEYNGHFRIATTTGHLARTAEQATAANHIYVLDMDLNIVGRLENLAPKESIYSARFVGNRGYLVTFRKVDPLFVIDLSDPKNPRVLGKLKIPGFSNYLHPYDDSHIIGVGKETVDAEEGDFSWFQGVKLGFFDVSDPEKPKEISKYVIGHRGTDSYVLRDHKAFLFSRKKNLLVIPILLAEIDEEKYPEGVPPNAYGDYVWQGAYVFELTPETGFVLKGRISHVDDPSFFEKSGYYFYPQNSVKRSLYIDDILYTISDAKIKMNGLPGLEEIKSVNIPKE